MPSYAGGQLVVAGDADASVLVQRIETDMPPGQLMDDVYIDVVRTRMRMRMRMRTLIPMQTPMQTPMQMPMLTLTLTLMRIRTLTLTLTRIRTLMPTPTPTLTRLVLPPQCGPSSPGQTLTAMRVMTARHRRRVLTWEARMPRS